MAFDFDLLVIGAGSGGVRAARMAAAKGVKVAIVEEKYFGGTCVNVGCVPKKLLVYAAQFGDAFAEAAGYGWQAQETTHDWPALIAAKDTEIARLNGIYQRLLANSGVEIIHGRANLLDGHTVDVAGKKISAEKILIAVGGKPLAPNFPGADYAFNSDQAFYLTERPKRIAIIGAGYIALEFAGIFKGLGSEVHVLARSQVLRHFDQTVAQFVANEIRKKGIQLHEQAAIERIEKDGQALRCVLADGSQLQVDAVMVATGRTPLTQGLGLENTAVTLRDNGSIITNERFQTAESSIYALGDVIGTPELTPVALAQAMVFVDQQFGSNTRVMSYDAIATAVFCQPNIATVGLTEQEVVAKGIRCDVYVSEFTPMKHSLTGTGEKALIKMLVQRDNQRVLGIHVVGSEAGEIVQGFAVAVKAALTKADLDATIGIHPTMAEELVTLREIKYTVN